MRNAVRGALWNAVENVGSQLTSFVLFLGFARLVSPSSIGVVQLVVTMLGFLTIFVQQGFTTRIVRAAECSSAMLSTAFWLGLLGSVALAGVLTGASDTIAAWYRMPELASVMHVLAWTIPLTILSCIQTALLVRDMAFRTQAIRRLVAVVVAGVVGIVLAFHGFGLWSLVARLVVESVVDCALAWWLTPWRPTAEVSRAESRAFFSFGSPIVGSYSINFMSRRCDEFLIGFVLGPLSLGYYTVAARAITLVTEVALRATQRTAVPVFARFQNEPDRLRDAYYAAIEFGTVIACPVFVGLSAVAPELCTTLYGPEWRPVIPAMQVLGFAGAGIAISMYTPPVLIAVGKPELLLRFSLAEAVLNVSSAAISVQFGIVGIAYAYVLRSYVVVAMTAGLMRRSIGTSWPHVLRRVVAPCTASLLMFVVVTGTRSLLLLPPPLMLVLLISLGALTYLAGMWVMGRTTLERLVTIAQVARS
jgi:O-antigen/teichoic acid export membrane protein